jgi:hypothetical protein
VSTSEPGEPQQTASAEAPEAEGYGPPPAPPLADPSVNGEAAAPAGTVDTTTVTFVPLAVTVGDGFKFGCGFFMAFVLAMLVGFVLLAALFAINSLLGLNLPPLVR